jgi:hypothetical protein
MFVIVSHSAHVAATQNSGMSQHQNLMPALENRIGATGITISAPYVRFCTE